ncbi:hypothetical protein FGLOB1_14181 [Fusarium globosum]|uniref:Uncharacterized protein n=1 Tax=Fusarium globosum TaxID=78864 RepID=A0A8H5XJA8_9HYPO|nr:hypothetical protein FGLOB1_14181 [Fusarium globosum]
MIALLLTLVLAVNAQDEQAHSAHAGSDGDGEVCDPGSETTQWWTTQQQKPDWLTDWLLGCELGLRDDNIIQASGVELEGVSNSNRRVTYQMRQSQAEIEGTL